MPRQPCHPRCCSATPTRSPPSSGSGATSEPSRPRRYDALPELPPRALYLLADLKGVPFEQDGIRDGEDFREAMQRWFVEELDARGEHWALISGSREERLEKSIRLVDGTLGL